MRRKSVCILIVVLGLLLLPGCVDLYANSRPGLNEDERWISEEPEMNFAWVEDVGFCGELTIDGQALPLEVCFDYGTGMDVYPFDPQKETVSLDNLLFRGQCSFRRNKVTMEVVLDQASIFEDELPTITFVRQEKQKDGTWK